MAMVFHLRQKALSLRLPIKAQELHSLNPKVAYLFLLGEELLELCLHSMLHLKAEIILPQSGI